MNANRWDEVKRILDALLDLPPDERQDALARRCGDDAELRSEVESLLRSHDEGDATIAVGGARSPLPSAASRQIGPYQLMQKLGEGGMGEVYLAKQSEPVKRHVALKVIKLGMDTKEVVARFQVERQALAVMDHPNIARVLDGGATDEGRPYFVMELVKGVPITQFCDEQKLSLDARVRLFITVCRAVQHAHQKGVIHRDLKPSNILVTLDGNQPSPKIIDFGVAKATGSRLTDQTLFTSAGQMVGTPEYMSPEQAVVSGLDIDTRTDIYSLGVVLYELLVGALPFDSKELRKKSIAEMQRVIREDTPPRPSTRITGSGDKQTDAAKRRATDSGTLTRRLKGDLDWIVMMAMEKDRTRRYETANAFAMDLSRFLDNETVTARPPSVTYRVGKFVRRNKLGVALATALTVALIGGVVGTGVGLVRSRGETRKAREVIDFLNNLLVQIDPEQSPGKSFSMREVLDTVAATVGTEVGTDPLVEAELRSTIGNLYVQLREAERAMPHLERAQELFTQYAGPTHDDTLKNQNRIASAVYRLGRFSDARQIWLELGNQSRKKEGMANATTLTLFHNAASAYLKERNYEAAEPLLLEVLQYRRELLGSDHLGTLATLSNLGDYYLSTNQFEKAGPILEEVLAVRRRTMEPNHPRLLNSVFNLGHLHAVTKNFDDAIPLLEEAHRGFLEIYDNSAHEDTLTAAEALAVSYLHVGRLDEAEALGSTTLDVLLSTAGTDSPRTRNAAETLADIYDAQGRGDEARQLLARIGERAPS